MALPLRERSVPKESSVSSEEDILAGAKESGSEKKMFLVKGAKKIKLSFFQARRSFDSQQKRILT